MEPCDVCEKELGAKYKTVDIYQTHLISRGVNKGKIGPAAVASEYGKFEPVTVKVCNSHLRGFYTQRFIPGFIAFVLLFIPIFTLISFIPGVKDNRTLMILMSVLVGLVVVYFLVRRITYDGYIASLLTLQPRNRAAKVEYFGQAKYRRILKNFARLDAVLKDSDRK